METCYRILSEALQGWDDGVCAADEGTEAPGLQLLCGNV